MKKASDFLRRIKALYATQGPGVGDPRPAELSTMFDVFLGEAYNKQIKLAIAKVQAKLHREQAQLVRDFEKGGIGPEKYVDSLNGLIGDALDSCKKILGPKDFERLFGTSWTRRKAFVNRSEFLRAPGR